MGNFSGTEAYTAAASAYLRISAKASAWRTVARSARAKPVSADEDVLELEVAGEVMAVRWDAFSPRRFLAAAKAYLEDDAEAQEALAVLEAVLKAEKE